MPNGKDVCMCAKELPLKAQGRDINTKFIHMATVVHDQEKSFNEIDVTSNQYLSCT